ncbi:MAG: DNA replication and repair protein RecF [Chloroflexota bacterium]|nr:DNA replication and repair protein RecF [Chloroflexota bacterium]
MEITKLILKDYRSFHRFLWEPSSGTHIIYGENGSGKSNLLEAISMLSTTRSPRTYRDTELVSWRALDEDPLPGAFISAEKINASKLVDTRESIDISISAAEPIGYDPNVPRDPKPKMIKQFQRNKSPQKASDVIGCIKSILFSARDLKIIEGTPADRRRYIDATISQLNRDYIVALREYNKILENRNSLLKQINAGKQGTTALDIWDIQASKAAAIIITIRGSILDSISKTTSVFFSELNPKNSADDKITLRYSSSAKVDSNDSISNLESSLVDCFGQARSLDISRGITTVGPHRDDLIFQLNRSDAGISASRGQLRSLALSLRLAEVELSRTSTGEQPILLLDDVLSELDEAHRERVTHLIQESDQTFITTPDPERPGANDLQRSSRWLLENNELSEMIFPI